LSSLVFDANERFAVHFKAELYCLLPEGFSPRSPVCWSFNWKQEYAGLDRPERLGIASHQHFADFLAVSYSVLMNPL
jgi:hypothetical protein